VIAGQTLDANSTGGFMHAYVVLIVSLISSCYSTSRTQTGVACAIIATRGGATFVSQWACVREVGEGAVT